MVEERSTGAEKVRFNYYNNETKYYLLTGGSGYPLADFYRPFPAGERGGGLVVPENRPQTANIMPGTDSSQLT
ncbi:MAG: hypothetical protein K6T80_02065 [Firmicutes bacterium]|nr:hypothetical protein [Bacillota bacterium]